MIHVFFCVNDIDGKYTKFTGISAMSIFQRTRSDVSIHILHNDTVSKENIERLEKLGDGVHHVINFYKVNESSLKELSNNQTNMGSMYRLVMQDVLPAEVEKLIYLDSDIVVNMDISKLYEFDLKGNIIGALESPAPGFWVFDEKIVNRYFNNGVMLIDLKQMRAKYDLLKETIKFFSDFNHEVTSDQDAFNYIFRNEWISLPVEFNSTTVNLRGFNLPCEERIYHFAGDAPDAWQREPFDRLFFHYWLRSPWADQFQDYFMEYANLQERRIMTMQGIIANSNKTIVIWGAKSRYIDKVFSHLPDREHLVLVDSNKALQGRIICGLYVQSSDTFFNNHKDCIVLILSGRYYDEIAEQLALKGYKEGTDYFDGSLLLREAEGGKMVPIDKGNLRSEHWRIGGINHDVQVQKYRNEGI